MSAKAGTIEGFGRGGEVGLAAVEAKVLGCVEMTLAVEAVGRKWWGAVVEAEAPVGGIVLQAGPDAPEGPVERFSPAEAVLLGFERELESETGTLCGAGVSALPGPPPYKSEPRRHTEEPCWTN